MQYVAWLLDEAWDHRRRRYRRFALAALAAGAISALVSVTISGGSRSTAGSVAAPPRPELVAPSRVLSRSPYLGVNCPIANSIACDRVGLAVWLKRPAVSVTATIAGARLALNWFGDERLSLPVPHRAFDGYLQPAGIVSRLHVRPVEGNEILTGHGRTRVIVSHQMWFGDGRARSPLIRLAIHYPNGHTVITQLPVGLAAGWG